MKPWQHLSYVIAAFVIWTAIAAWAGNILPVMGGVYLFIILGAEFRGRRYMALAQVLCVGGFVYLIMIERMPIAYGLGWLMTLIIIPWYVSILRAGEAKARRAQPSQTLSPSPAPYSFNLLSAPGGDAVRRERT